VSFVANGPEVAPRSLGQYTARVRVLSGSVTGARRRRSDARWSGRRRLDVGKLARFFPRGRAEWPAQGVALGKPARRHPAATGSLEVDNFVLWGLSSEPCASDLAVDEGVHLRGSGRTFWGRGDRQRRTSASPRSFGGGDPDAVGRRRRAQVLTCARLLKTITVPASGCVPVCSDVAVRVVRIADARSNRHDLDLPPKRSLAKRTSAVPSPRPPEGAPGSP